MDHNKDFLMHSENVAEVKEKVPKEVLFSNGDISTEKLRLSSWGVPQSVVTAYEERGIVEMFQWQAECLSVGKVFAGGNLVYSAPTSAGKTMVAEILMLKRILQQQGQKAIFVLPFVSIAREKMFYLQSLFQNAGVRVDGYMGSHNPAGGFASVDIAVCTIEKANGLVNRLLEEEKLHQLGILVIDELHMVGDSHRGYLLELLLTKVLFSTARERGETPPTQIVGMSATLPNLDVLALWLRADLYRTDFRPVPLEEFIKIGGDVYDASTASKVSELPKYVLKSTGQEDSDHVVYLCLETITRGNSVLVFCPAKQWCEKLAENIAREIYELGKLNGDSAISELCKEWGLSLRQVLDGSKLSDICEQLKRCPAGLDTILGLTVPFGVAFHHAGLTFDERDIIEGAYRHGYVKVLVATTTLSSGVNLPARRVIIRSPFAHGVALDVLCYKQMVGRAGRKGVDTKGESILLCKETERNTATKLINSSPKPVRSCLLKGDVSLSSSLKRAILEVIASDAATTPQDVSLYASCTLLATSLANEIAGNTENKTQVAVDACINYLTDNEFIYFQKLDKDGIEEIRYAPSRLGKAVLSSSLSPDEALSLLRELKKAHKCFVLENELHLVYQVTPPFLMDHLGSSINWMEYLSIWDQLSLDMKKVGELVGVEERFLASSIGGVNHRGQTKELAVHLRFYAALALHDLVQEVKFTKVVDKYKIPRGVLQSLQQSASTFSGMVAAFCKRLGWKNMELLIKQFQQRLHFGVQQELCDLLRLNALNAQMARVLYDAGYEMASTLAKAYPRDIEIILKNAKPFSSEKSREVDNGKEGCHVWITGMKGVTERQAAELMVKEAQFIVEKDLGVEKINWNNTNEHARPNTNENSSCRPKSNSTDRTPELDQTEKKSETEKHESVFRFSDSIDLGLDKTSTPKCASATKIQFTVKTFAKAVSKIASAPKNDSETFKITPNKFVRAIEEISKRLPSDEVVTKSSNNSSHTDEKVSNEFEDLNLANVSLGSDFSDQITPSRRQSSTSKGSDNIFASPLSDSSKIDENQIGSVGSSFFESQGENSSLFRRAQLASSKRCNDVSRSNSGVSVSSDQSRSISSKSTNSLTIAQKPVETTYISFQTSVTESDDFNKALFGSEGFDVVGSSQPQSEDIFKSTPNVCLEISNKSSSKRKSSENFGDSIFDQSDFAPTSSFTNLNNTENNKPSSQKCLKSRVSGARKSESNGFLIFGDSVFAQDSAFDCSTQSQVVIAPPADLLKPLDEPSSKISLKSPGRRFRHSPPSKLSVPLEKSISSRNCLKEKVNNGLAAMFQPELNGPPSKLLKGSEIVKKSIFPSKNDKCYENQTLGESILAKIDNMSSFEDSVGEVPVVNGKNTNSSANVVSDGSFTISPTPDCSKSKLKSSVRSTLRSSRRCASSKNSAVLVETSGVRTRSQRAVPSQCTGDGFCIIDVASTRQLFDVFLDEWKTQSSFSLSIACERQAGSMILVEDHYVLDEVEQEDKVVGYSVCWGSKDAYYVDFNEPNNDSLFYCEVNRDERVRSLGDGLKRSSEHGPVSVGMFDFKTQLNIISAALQKLQLAKLLSKFDCVDPKIAEWLIDPSAKEKTLLSLVVNYLPEHVQLLSVLTGTYGTGCIGGSTSNKDGGRLRSSLESVLVFHLMNTTLNKLKENYLQKPFHDIEMPTLVILSQMDQCGFGYDPSVGEIQKDTLTKHLSNLESIAFKLAKRPFNMISPKDVAKLLYKELRLPNPNKDSRDSNTGKNALAKLKAAHPLPGIILEWRRVSCALNKFLNPLAKAAYFHPKYKMPRISSETLTLTATGRISMREPNIQNIPRDFEISCYNSEGQMRDDDLKTVSLRNAFVPYQGGIFISADYSQLELRILAHLSNETKLKEILNSGDDVFISVASNWLSISKDNVTKQQRQRAKQICYGIIYGMGTKSMAEQLEVEETEAAELMDTFHRNYPQIRAFTNSVIENAFENGYVETIFGRRRYLPGIKSSNSNARSAAQRQAVNTRVQGSAADLVKKATININNEIDNLTIKRKKRGFSDINLVLQLHDELIYEVPVEYTVKLGKIIKGNMEGVAPSGILLPVNLKKGNTWGTLQEFKI